MSLIINLAVGGNFPGNPDPNVFPQTFDIDYARYWTRDETELINPDFDRSGNLPQRLGHFWQCNRQCERAVGGRS